jgi:hypothetical protein
LDAATTYAWTLADTPNAPDGTASVAALLAPENSNTSTARFIVDNEGAYLVRLVVDQGLPTESTQFIRTAYKTKFGNILMVAAGERRDETGTIPVDASAKGWSGIQNENIQRILGIMRRTASSGRVLYVDSNRGRDRTANSDDATNTFELPGSDTSGTADELIITAEKHGDFSTVGEAITYAAGSVGRGEPAPSQGEPWLIKIKPGLYSEDLVFQPWIHLMGEGTAQWASASTPAEGSHEVVLRTANAAGQSHRFQPSADTDQVHLMNLRLENTDAAAVAPVLLVDRGVFRAEGCVIAQMATAIGPGAALSVTGANYASLLLFSSSVVSYQDNADTDVALKIDLNATTVKLVDVDLKAVRTAFEVNASLFEMPAAQITLRDCDLVSSNGIAARVYGPAQFTGGVLQGATAAQGLVLDGFGAGAATKPGGVPVSLTNVVLAGQITVDDIQAVGAVTVTTSGLTMPRNATPPSPFLLTTGTPTMEHTLRAFSLGYDGDWQGWDGTDVSPAVPATAQVGNKNVQDVLDILLNLVMPLGISPFWSLTTAYNGLANPSPLTLGAGLGRSILADDGAVQITGASSPVGFTTGFDADLNGGLQVEGQLDVGSFGVDGKGSEITLDPNTWGGGPILRFGRTVYPPGYGAAASVNAVARVIAGPQLGTATELNAYNMKVGSRDLGDANQGELGSAILAGGSRLDTAAGTARTAGDAVVRAGDHMDATDLVGEAGDLLLAPGYAANANHGVVIVACPDTGTSMTLDAANPFPGNIPVNSGGTLFLQAADGSIIAVSIPDGTNYATVQSSITTASAGHIVASDNGGTLRLTSGSVGTLSALMVVGDNVPAGAPGDLLIALGELRLASGAVEVPGAYPDVSTFRCSASGEITFDGDVVVSGTLSASVSPPYAHTVVNLVITTEDIIGVDTATGAAPLDITLPAASAGRRVTIKDEVGNAATHAVNIQVPAAETIDGAVAPLVLIADWASATVYSDGTNWFIV